MTRFVTTAAGIAIALLASTAPAQYQATQKAGDGMLLRTYDVADLILSVEDRPYQGAAFSSANQVVRPTGGGGGFGGGGGVSQPAYAPTTNRVTISQIVGTITDTIAPASWGDTPAPQRANRPRGSGRGGFGGGFGEEGDFGGGEFGGPTPAAPQGGARIAVVGASLVVLQSPAEHNQIATLLDALAQNLGNRRTLRVDARWLLLTSDELDKLQDDKLKISRTAMEDFTRRSTSLRGTTNCFSGQKVHLISGTQRTNVTSWIPVVGSVNDPYRRRPGQLQGGSTVLPVGDYRRGDGKPGQWMNFASNPGVGYQPVTTTNNFGTLLEIRPTLLRDGKSVVVDLESHITAAVEPTKTEQPKENPSGAPLVDRVAIEKQSLATTLGVKLGEPCLVGGMTYAPASTNANGASNAELYLILEIR
ncbi:MAG: hypothetical protein AAGJ46_00415 [Planctomycetota bacterium]